jgi:hypothetical protein
MQNAKQLMETMPRRKSQFFLQYTFVIVQIRHAKKNQAVQSPPAPARFRCPNVRRYPRLWATHIASQRWGPRIGFRQQIPTTQACKSLGYWRAHEKNRVEMPRFYCWWKVGWYPKWINACKSGSQNWNEWSCKKGHTLRQVIFKRNRFASLNVKTNKLQGWQCHPNGGSTSVTHLPDEGK